MKFKLSDEEIGIIRRSLCARYFILEDCEKALLKRINDYYLTEYFREQDNADKKTISD